jgi:phenylalanyl-tRNA synthetase alpha chain
MLEHLDSYFSEVENYEIKDKDTLEAFRLKFIAKNGLINDLFEAFKAVAPDQKKLFGGKLNQLKQLAEGRFKTSYA